MNYEKLNNEQLYLMVKDRILSSTYWQKNLFRTFSGYRVHELRQCTRHTFMVNGKMEARIEDLRVCFFALPYLAKGKPTLTNSKKEKNRLISFLNYVESKDRSRTNIKYEDALQEYIEGPKAEEPSINPEVQEETNPQPEEKPWERKPKHKVKEEKVRSLSIEDMEAIIKDGEERDRKCRTPEYMERCERAFDIVKKALSLDEDTKVSRILEASEMVEGKDKMKILKTLVPFMTGTEKKNLMSRIKAIDKEISLVSIAKFRLAHNIII